MQRPRLAGARFSRHRDPHVSGPRLRKDERMSRAPRLAGYALMAAAALLALAMRRGEVDAIGPFPAVAVALFLGMLGMLLVFTDLMVRGLYAQVDAEKREGDAKQRSGERGVGKECVRTCRYRG